MSNLLSASEAAAFLGITTAALRKARQRGTMPATAKIAGLHWFYSQADLERYLREVRRDGTKHSEEQRAAWRSAQAKHRERAREHRGPTA